MFQEKAMHYKEKKRSKTLVFLLTVDVCICVCILLAAWAVFLKEPQAVALAPDVAPSEVEPNQIPMEENSASGGDSDASSSSSASGKGKNKVGLRYTEDVVISLSEKKAALVFGNKSSSAVDIVMQIVVQDHVIAQTGKLTPGNQVEQLDLSEGAVELLCAGEYEGKYMLYYYDPDTGEKSNVDTVIPIRLTVQ